MKPLVSDNPSICLVNQGEPVRSKQAIDIFSSSARSIQTKQAINMFSRSLIPSEGPAIKDRVPTFLFIASWPEGDEALPVPVVFWSRDI
ncbi:hypothetical protein J6590_005287 [Homalodisca vitripennis]|nr:hypothetical protein J6590_005287 [Homalodisca vitripennis]